MTTVGDVALIVWFTMLFPVSLGAYADGGLAAGMLSLAALALLLPAMLATAYVIDARLD